MPNLKSLISILFICGSLHATAVPLTTLDLNQIYQNLQSAIGDQSRQFPKLEIRPGANSVLAYNQRKNVIFVDEKVLQICDEFGENAPDAIAFLLAHEMTHFYQKHKWEEAGFASEFLTKKSTFNEHVEDERAADLYGAYVTHLAGYQSIKLIPALFEKVYQTYGLDENLLDYPSLQERQKIAQEVCKKAKELIILFDTANYLNAIGEHLAAATAYEHLLQLVQYKELYNNLGASLVAEAARTTPFGETKFRYPLALDWDIALRDGVGDRREILAKAIQYLAKATQMDATHYNSFINLACAYVLDNQLDAANDLLKKMQNVPQDAEQLAEVNILLAILRSKEGKTSEAEAILKAMMTTTSSAGLQDLAQQNLRLLQGATIVHTTSPLSSTTHAIGGIDLLYQNEFPFKKINLFNTYLAADNELQIYETTTAKLAHFVIDDKTIALLLSCDNNQETTSGIQINSLFKEVKMAYPIGNILPHNRGYYYVATTEQLVFYFNKNNRVEEWGTYAIY